MVRVEVNCETGEHAIIELTPEEILQLPAPISPSLEQIKAEFTVAIQKRLDGFAQERSYDNILSACTYATSAVPKFKAEGEFCVMVRDQTWNAAYELMERMEQGMQTIPLTDDEVMSNLPILTWGDM